MNIKLLALADAMTGHAVGIQHAFGYDSFHEARAELIKALLEVKEQLNAIKH